MYHFSSLEETALTSHNFTQQNRSLRIPKTPFLGMRFPIFIHHPVDSIGVFWVTPLPSNSGKWRFRLESPTKHEIILVVTITGKGDNPRCITFTYEVQNGSLGCPSYHSSCAPHRNDNDSRPIWRSTPVVKTRPKPRCWYKGHHNTLRIRLYVLRMRLPLHSYSEDGIGTLNPILGRGLDS